MQPSLFCFRRKKIIVCRYDINLLGNKILFMFGNWNLKIKN